MTKLTIVLRQFADAPKIEIFPNYFEEVPVVRVLNVDICLVLSVLICSRKLIRFRKFVAC